MGRMLTSCSYLHGTCDLMSPDLMTRETLVFQVDTARIETWHVLDP